MSLWALVQSSALYRNKVPLGTELNSSGSWEAGMYNHNNATPDSINNSVSEFIF
jgi:hypothetical protein